MNNPVRFLCGTVVVGLLTVVLAMQCTTPVAGGGTEGGNTVCGKLSDKQGNAIAKAVVRLIPSDYNAGDVHQKGSLRTTIAGSDGRYSFEKITDGRYSVEASDTLSGMLSLSTGLEVADDDTLIADDVLREPGVLVVTIPESARAVSGYIYIPGTTLYARLSAVSNKVTVRVPSNKPLPAICLQTSGDTVPGVLRYNVQVGSGDTSVVARPEWKYARRLHLNTTPAGAGVPADIAGFPVLIRLTQDNFNFSEARADGGDLRFSRSDTVSLAYEVERWDSSNRKAEIWVAVDTVFGNDSTQFITMYSGNAGAAGNSNAAAVFDTSDKYIGVWHLSENPASGASAMSDGTVNSFDATPFGAMAEVNSVEGAVGNALRFDGVDDYLDAGNVSIPAKYSIGLWVRMDTLGRYERFIYKDSCYTLWYDRDTASVRAEHRSPNAWWSGMFESGGTLVPMLPKVWSFLVATYDGSAIRLYKDGIEVSKTGPITVVPRTNTFPLLIGKSDEISMVKGVMDELRIEGAARSADWIRLCYMNQRPDDKLVQYR